MARFYRERTKLFSSIRRYAMTDYSIFKWGVAKLVKAPGFDPGIPGSNPGTPAIYKIRYRQPKRLVE